MYLSFGPETNRLLSKLPEPDRKEQIKSFKVFDISPQKLSGHLDKHPAYAYYKAVRVFDPRQLAIVGHDILMSSQVLSIHQQSYMKNGLYICNYHQVLSIHQQSFMKNGLYICNYHQVFSIHQQSYMKNGLYICNYHQVLSIHQQSYMKNGLYIYAI